MAADNLRDNETSRTMLGVLEGWLSDVRSLPDDQALVILDACLERFTPEVRKAKYARIDRLLKAGLSLTDVGELLGITRQRVHTVATAYRKGRSQH